MPIFTLPGDKMFQATGLGSNRQRPPIMHFASTTVHCERGLDPACCCYGGNSWQTTSVGGPWAATSSGLRWTSSLGLVPFNTEMWPCSSHAGNGGISGPLLTVPLIRGSRGPTQRMGLIVKTRHTSDAGTWMK